MPLAKVDKDITYISPEDKDGNHYWVPIVIKNKDTLVGFSEGANLLLSMYESDIPYSASMALSSERFIDYTVDGTRLVDKTDEELEEYITEILTQSIDKVNSEHVDDNTDITEEYFFHMSCTCGNFFGYRVPHDIPETNIDCEICGKRVLEYIHHDDEELVYIGMDIDKFNKKIYEVKNKLGL